MVPECDSCKSLDSKLYVQDCKEHYEGAYIQRETECFKNCFIYSLWLNQLHHLQSSFLSSPVNTPLSVFFQSWNVFRYNCLEQPSVSVTISFNLLYHIIPGVFLGPHKQKQAGSDSCAKSGQLQGGVQYITKNLNIGQFHVAVPLYFVRPRFKGFSFPLPATQMCIRDRYICLEQSERETERPSG